MLKSKKYAMKASHPPTDREGVKFLAMRSALGRMPAGAKQAFINNAGDILQRLKDIQKLDTDGVDALTEVANRAEALGRALARVKRGKLTNAYLDNAWAELTRGIKTQKEPVFPDETDLLLIAKAARLWLPSPHNSARRPTDYGPIFFNNYRSGRRVQGRLGRLAETLG